jgi:hypothetical protein
VPFRGLIGRDGPQGRLGLKALQEFLSGEFQVGQGAGLEFWAATVQIALQPRAQQCGFPRLDEFYGSQTLMQLVRDSLGPAGGLFVEHAQNQPLHVQFDVVGLLHGGVAETDGLSAAVAVHELDTFSAARIGDDACHEESLVLGS